MNTDRHGQQMPAGGGASGVAGLPVRYAGTEKVELRAKALAWFVGEMTAMGRDLEELDAAEANKGRASPASRATETTHEKG